MGLMERRYQQEYEKERIPKRLEEFKSSYCPNANLSVQIDWSTFEGKKEALEAMWTHWEQPLQGLEGVCKDDLGKEAVAGGVKSVVIKNVDSTEQVKCEFKDGVLTAWMNFKDGGNGTPGWSAFTEVVEAGL